MSEHGPLLVQVSQLARRSVVRTFRQPINVVPSFLFPLMLLAVNVGVVLRPYRKEPVVTYTKIKIPDSATTPASRSGAVRSTERLIMAPWLKPSR